MPLEGSYQHFIETRLADKEAEPPRLTSLQVGMYFEQLRQYQRAFGAEHDLAVQGDWLLNASRYRWCMSVIADFLGLLRCGSCRWYPPTLTVRRADGEDPSTMAPCTTSWPGHADDCRHSTPRQTPTSSAYSAQRQPTARPTSHPSCPSLPPVPSPPFISLLRLCYECPDCARRG